MSARRPMLLVVDDDAGFAYAVWRHFEAANYRVVTANGSTEALRELAKSTFDAVVCDIRFGRNEPNGLQLTEKIKSSHPELPLILVTAYPELVSGSNVPRDVKVLHKPVELALLKRAVDRLVAV
jgi:DNA-binding NtrC family response regulator